MRVLLVLVLACTALACQKTIHEVRHQADSDGRPALASARP